MVREYVIVSVYDALIDAEIGCRGFEQVEGETEIASAEAGRVKRDVQWMLGDGGVRCRRVDEDLGGGRINAASRMG